jgi:transcriptional regulator with XRE-family HTH domain
MDIKTIKGKQIAAARALAEFTLDDLAKRSGVSRSTIVKIEAGNVEPRGGTLADLVKAFADADKGVEFTEGGVRWRSDIVRQLEGADAYLEMLDDVYKTLHKSGGEVLWLCSNDQVPRTGEYEAEVRIRDSGIRFRSLIEEGKTETVWPRNEYRQIPSRYFHHNLQVIYANKVAQVLEGGKRILIVDNRELAAATRNLFDLIWSFMKMPPKPEKHNAK